MDPRTCDYYRRNWRQCAERYDAADLHQIHALLRRHAPPGSSVLDIGGGSGRDAALLADLGCTVTYTDGCEQIMAAALEKHPSLRGRTRLAAFPIDAGDPLLVERFDLVLCLAVIMHLDDASFRETARQIGTLTADRGQAVVSHSTSREGIVDSRDAHGRLFVERSGAEVEKVFADLGFGLCDQLATDDRMGRASLKWLTQVFRKES